MTTIGPQAPSIESPSCRGRTLPPTVEVAFTYEGAYHTRQFTVIGNAEAWVLARGNLISDVFFI